MKKTKKIVKRDIYKSDRSDISKKRKESSKRLSRSECSGTAVVYCNQWECFTRFLCRDEDSDSDLSKGAWWYLCLISIRNWRLEKPSQSLLLTHHTIAMSKCSACLRWSDPPKISSRPACAYPCCILPESIWMRIPTSWHALMFDLKCKYSVTGTDAPHSAYL